MKMYGRKKIVILMLACLVGAQPVVSASSENEDWVMLQVFIGCVVLYNAPTIFREVRRICNSIYRHVNYTLGYESENVKKMKEMFDHDLNELEAVSAFAWRDNCYTKLFSEQSLSGVKKFVKQQETIAVIDEANPFGKKEICDITERKNFVSRLKKMNLHKQELELYVVTVDKSSTNDLLDLYIFTDYALPQIDRVRQQRRNNLLSVCCGMYLCKSDVKDMILKQCPNITASRMLDAFASAWKIQGEKNSIDNRQGLITAGTILPLCFDGA